MVKYFGGFLQGTLLTCSWFWWILTGSTGANPVIVVPIIITVVTLIAWGGYILENWNRN